MARAHIVVGGIVVNSVDAVNLIHPDGLLMVWATTISDIGWLWNGSTASPPPPTQAQIEAAERALAIKNHKARLRSELGVLEKDRARQVFAADPEWLNTQIKINKLNDQLNEV